MNRNDISMTLHIDPSEYMAALKEAIMYLSKVSNIKHRKTDKNGKGTQGAQEEKEA